MIKKAEVAYAWFLKIADGCQSPFLLLVRLFWGWQFWQSGWAHLHDMPKFVDFFISLGIPAPSLNAHFVAVLEFGGGILLALGLGSRLISLLLAGDMLVAFITADREALLSIFSDTDKFYAAAPYTLLFASLLVLFFGPGMFSLDTLVARYFKKRQTAAA
ncbi:MAG: DoxX family protein [Acidobacteriia bacterium]|nr:DoxX family protein [Terriglobia bacterium]